MSVTCNCGDQRYLIIWGSWSNVSQWDLAQIFSWISQVALLHLSKRLQWWSHLEIRRKERQVRRTEYIAITHFQKLLCATSSCHGQEKCFSDKWFPVTSLRDKFEICFSVVTLTEQDDALSAASSVHLGGAPSSWLCPVQRTASCSTHTWWHHHWSVVLCTSSASCWQGKLGFLCLCLSAAWFMCHGLGIQLYIFSFHLQWPSYVIIPITRSTRNPLKMVHNLKMGQEYIYFKCMKWLAGKLLEIICAVLYRES